jgi:tripartite-type tricarboxylate transporter receptor subunit TctC
MPATAALIRSGRLKGIAVSGTTRSSALPDVPTVSESGLPGYSCVGWFGVMAPRGTPRSIIDKLRSAVEKAITPADVSRQLQQVGADVVTNTP